MTSVSNQEFNFDSGKARHTPRVLDVRNFFKFRNPKWKRKILVRKDREEYLKICSDNSCRPLVKQTKKSWHFLKWTIKLFVPDFLIGHPNLFDNFKILVKNPQFRPLRLALAAWLIFALTFGSAGIYVLNKAPKSFATTCSATGGTITQANGYCIHTFLAADSGTNFTPTIAGNVEVLVVAQGGGGGAHDGSGGGAGGVLYTASHAVTAQAYVVTVGSAGGAGSTSSNGVAGDGANSVFDTLTAIGGGGGISRDAQLNGRTGGSGSGGSSQNNTTGGNGTPGQGNNGGNGINTAPAYGAGGGGGASAVGGNGTSAVGGNGGAGIADASVGGLLTAASAGVGGYIAGGGGSGVIGGNPPGTGGSGGGGAGGMIAAGSNGTANTGGGGGGGGSNNYRGGDGGSGIVIVRYLPNSPPNTPTNSSPANASTTVALNPALTASAYSDPESDLQADARWELDDNADFSALEWTRTAGVAETSVIVNSTNGTFANNLSGKTDLVHNTTYYWRVAYQENTSDAFWSASSTATSFTTNTITTPVNSLPVGGAISVILTPLLSASLFSDAQAGHTHTASQWQIRNSADPTYTNPVYDSGATTTALTSLGVPSGTLAKNTTYFWKVHYKDDKNYWSEYSLETAFTTGVTPITIVSVGATEYQSGEITKLTVQIQSADGTPLNSATTIITIFDPSNVATTSAASMIYLTGSNGLYYYNYTIPATEGVYTYQVTATYNGSTSYSSHAFHVSPALNTIATLNTNLNTVNTNLNTTNTNLNTVNTNVNSANSTLGTVNTNLNTANSALTTVGTQVENASSTLSGKIIIVGTQVENASTTVMNKLNMVSSNLDILIGAFIVTQSSVNDSSASTTAFITNLSNSTNDFYKNSVLSFTSGDLSGQNRRISAYDGATKKITLDPALTSIPANSVTFTIITQNVRVEEQATDIQTKVTDIQTKTNSIYALLQTVDTNLSAAQTKIDSIRSSQQKFYKIKLSDVEQIQAGNTYRAKLAVIDYENNPADASATPTISIYDPVRATTVATTTMMKTSTGVYEYAYTTSSSATTGLWEAVVNTAVGTSATSTLNDYWQVTGSPAQVVINSISDLTVPSITANVTIQNEGSGAFEYQYEYCVVSSQDNQCGGNDDVAYASAAKLISAGDSFTKDLALTVPNTGTYWFKVVVYYGTQASGASQQFNATTASAVAVTVSGAVQVTSLDTLSKDLITLRGEVKAESGNLSKILKTLGEVDVSSPGFKSLLEINQENTAGIKEIQNKLADLKAVSAVTQKVIESKAAEPVIETYMKFNSVEINFLITNPANSKQIVKFKSFLPEEARPEHILNASGLKVDYDANAKTYYVYGDINLAAKQAVTRKVEMEDIWVFDEGELNLMKKQADDLVKTFAKTQFEGQGTLLKGDIEFIVNIILLKQKDSYSSPQIHIVTYRENKERMAKVQSDLEKLKDLVVQAGASRGIVGSIGGIQTFSTWGIILAIIFGFGLLAVTIFAMWRHQMMLFAATMGVRKKFPVTVREIKIKKAKIVSSKHLGISPSAGFSWKKIFIWVFVCIAVVGISAIAYMFRENLFGSGNSIISKSAVTQEFQNNLNSSATTSTEQVVQPKSVLQPSPQVLKILDTPAKYLNVRGESSLQGKLIGKVYPGEQYKYLKEENSWYQIVLSENKNGWVSGNYVKIINE